MGFPRHLLCATVLVACRMAFPSLAAAQFPAMPPLPNLQPQSKPPAPTKQTQPAAKPTKPAAKPTQPAATKPTPPVAKPAQQPAAKPAQPAAKSTPRPVARRTQPTAKIGQSFPPDDLPAPIREATGLAAKKVWPIESVPIFQDDGRNLRFDLATSWIRSAEGRGMLRYQLTASPAPPSDAPYDEASIGSLADQQQFLARATACDFTLVLYDSDRFELVEIPLTLKHGVDREGNWSNLADNHIVRMDAEMYRTFLQGGYGVTWECNRGEGPVQRQ